MPCLFFSFHDPRGLQTEHLQKILPILKENFQGAFVSVTPETVKQNPASTAFLQSNPFFTVNLNEEGSTLGEHYLSGFRNVVADAQPDQLIHLAAPDRLAFALLGKYRNIYLEDIKKIGVGDTPFLFTRSEVAWATHPQNYYAAEMMSTVAGKLLFGKTLDFTWCYLVLTVRQLSELLEKITTKDLVIFAEMVYLLKDKIKTKEVDWLSWEDPFVFGKDPEELKREREKDPLEVERRLSYVLPVIRYLLAAYTHS